MTDNKSKKIALIGSGMIGKSWAMLFASAGYNVVLYDVDESMLNGACDKIRSDLEALHKLGLSRGSLSLDDQMKLIRTSVNFEETVKDAFWIQECVPEMPVDIKLKVFKQLDVAVNNDDTIISSSASAHCPSTLAEAITDNEKRRTQVIVSHPLNPPFYARAVELVGSKWTSKEVVKKAFDVLTSIGQMPVIIRKECYGHVLNRMQYALMNECWHLVNDGLVDVEGLDLIMKEGLAMRYAFMGPWETIHLNADGLKNYCERYSKLIFDASQNLKPPVYWDPEGDFVQHLQSEITKTVPLESLVERRQWRDRRMAALAKLKKDMDEKDKK